MEKSYITRVWSARLLTMGVYPFIAMRDFTLQELIWMEERG